MSNTVLWPEYCLCGVSYFLLPNYTNFVVFFLFALFIEEPVFLPKYSQTPILHAAHFWRVVNQDIWDKSTVGSCRALGGRGVSK